MNIGPKIVGLFLIGVVAAALAQQHTALAGEPNADSMVRSYYIDISFFSFKPGDALKTYDWYGGGGTGAHGTWGSGTTAFGRSFSVSVSGERKGKSFTAIVIVSPEKSDRATRPQQTIVDLGNLESKSLDLVHNDDGRVFRLNLTPRIDEAAKPKQFDANDLNLDHWEFQGSPVIVNDEDYVGELNMSGAPIATIKLPGFADFEFSLLHLKGAEPIGALQAGTINITRPDGTTVRISNVSNGGVPDLPGGPYVVWVLWKAPSQSLEQVRKLLTQLVAGEAEKMKRHEPGALAPARLKVLEEMLTRRSPAMMESGLKVVEPGDLEEPAKIRDHSGGKTQ